MQPPSFMPEYTKVLIPVLYHGPITCAVTNVICVAIDMVQGAHNPHMPILGMNALNGFAQFAQRMTGLNVI